MTSTEKGIDNNLLLMLEQQLLDSTLWLSAELGGKETVDNPRSSQKLNR